MKSEQEKIFKGKTLILVPHMDDAVLAMGGLIAKAMNKKNIHIVYATDGTQSPMPLFSKNSQSETNLFEIRKKEAERALNLLGIDRDRIHFLGLPDSKLKANSNKLYQEIKTVLEAIKPHTVFTPFRFDRHPDHLALTTVILNLFHQGPPFFDLMEYFVYYRWKMIAGGDIRRYIRPDQIFEIDIQSQNEVKRQALQCFTSQTTCFFPWQKRPIITEDGIREVCEKPEYFLKYNPEYRGTQIFKKNRFWFYLVHLIEPKLKILKEWIKELFS